MARIVSGPNLLYLLVVAVTALAVVPVCRRVFAGARAVPLVSIGVTIGIPLASLLFSLVARLLPSYSMAIPLTLLLLAVPWAWPRWRPRQALVPDVAEPGAGGSPAGWDRRADAVLLGAYALLFTVLLVLRSGWPSLYWANDALHAGSEKAFNFSLIQAYLFGQGYPPENLWFAGQPVDYYVLLHALPGLVSWGWRILTGDGAAGGGLFLFSDVFLLLLGSFAVSAWAHALLTADDSGLSRRQSLFLSVALGIGVLLSTHAKAVWMVAGAVLGGAEPAWWELEREVVPYTYSQYPFYLLLQGDHHPYQRVFFLQVALCGAMVLLFQSLRWNGPRVLLAGALAAAVWLAHSGSALLDVVVFGLAAVGLAGLRIWRGERPLLRALVANVGGTAAVALALSVPALLGGTVPVIWYWVERGIASGFLDFLQAQAGPLVFFAAACAAGVVASRSLARAARNVGEPVTAAQWWPWGAAALVIAVMAVGRGGAAVAAACAALVLLFAPRRSPSGEDRAPVVILAASVFAVWLLPEFLVTDLASRRVVEWKRWNFAMRFWLEAHYLVPFLALLAFAPALQVAIAKRAYVRAVATVSALVGLLWLVVHAYGVADRRARTPDVPGLDGTAFLARQHPCDAAIIGHLRAIEGRVQIGEICGTGEVIRGVPMDYGWAGRIAAYSGRPGVCGWSRHVWQFTRTLRRGPEEGQWTWAYFQQYERQVQRAYAAAGNGSIAADTRAYLDRIGVTHVVLGEQERRLFPGSSADGLARALDGTVEYEAAGNCAVVRLPDP